MIRGKKNFLPPHPLIMGFGLLFRLDESSLGSHLNERRVRGEEEAVNDILVGDVQENEDVPLEESSDSGSEKERKVEERPAESEVTSLPKLNQSGSTKSERHIENISETADGGVPSVSPALEDLIDRALGLGNFTAKAKDNGVVASHIDFSKDPGHDEKKSNVRDKPYISKADRKKLKKGQRTTNEIEQEKDKVTDSVSGTHCDLNTETGKNCGGKLSRGQRSKLKKMKEKYADQDDEERNIRMALLAVSIRIVMPSSL